MTESEIKFELFCNAHNIQFNRINTGLSKTPDYDIVVNGQKIVIEVKELQANDEDKKTQQDMETKVSATWDISPNRIRSKIDKSKRQIESGAKGLCPSLLILYDVRPVPVKGIYPNDILVAMYGVESIDIHVPKKIGEPVRFGNHCFGKGKRFREGVHAYISGLAILSENTSNALHLDIYLNKYADKPLPHEIFLQIKDIETYELPQNNSNEFRNWVKITNNTPRPTEEKHHDSGKTKEYSDLN